MPGEEAGRRSDARGNDPGQPDHGPGPPRSAQQRDPPAELGVLRGEREVQHRGVARHDDRERPPAPVGDRHQLGLGRTVEADVGVVSDPGGSGVGGRAELQGLGTRVARLRLGKGWKHFRDRVPDRPSGHAGEHSRGWGDGERDGQQGRLDEPREDDPGAHQAQHSERRRPLLWR
jgi:hypothetical protein